MEDVTRTNSDDRTPFERFKDLTSRLLHVSKEELQDALKRDKQESTSKKDED